MSKRITAPFLILSEGKADRAFLGHLLAVREIEHNFEFFYEDNKYGAGNTVFGDFLQGLPVERGFENVKAILIITDCDENPVNSFGQIQEQIRAAGFNVPENPFDIVKTNNLPALVVVMVPFDNVCGNLESYVVRAMEDVWGDVKASTDRHINETRAAGWGICKKAKSAMQCMIGVLNEEDPNKSLAYIWSSNEEFRQILRHEVFDDLANYLANFPALLET